MSSEMSYIRQRLHNLSISLSGHVKAMKELDKALIKYERKHDHTDRPRYTVAKINDPNKPEDNLLKRERLEKAPKFTDEELWNHTVLHKQDKLPYHKHKASTSRQFKDFVKRGAEKKDREDAKRIKADRAALAKSKSEDEVWKDVLKNNPVKNIQVKFHPASPEGPYAWITWNAPKESKYKILGFHIEINGSAWGMRPPKTPGKELLRSWRAGSKVRIGVEYRRRKGVEAICWSKFKYCK